MFNVLRQSGIVLCACCIVVGCGQESPPSFLDPSTVAYEQQLLLEEQVGATWFLSDGFAIDFDYLDQEIFHFDIDAYLDLHGPHLLPFSEIITHFSTMKSISPRLLLALMEQQTQAVTNPNVEANAPFAGLSDEIGFLQQVRDVCTRLRSIATPEGASPQENWPQDAISLLLPGANLSQLGKIYQRLFPGVTSAQSYLETKTDRQMIDLQFPYPKDETWQNWWGGHSDSGSGSAFNSLDFADGVEGSHAPGWGKPVDVYVVASAAGTAQVGSSCYLKIKHTDGWSTTYYHMDHIMVKTGDTVEANQPVGKYADNKAQAICSGGGSGAQHVHWGIWKNNSPVSLQGKVVAGWTINLGPSNYYGKCDKFYFHRDGEKVCAAYNLDNSGGDKSPTITFTAPTNNLQIEIDQTGTASVTVTAEVENQNPLTEVRLYLDGDPHGQSLTTPPFEWKTKPGPGVHSLKATATDSEGNVGESATISLTVVDGIAPTVAITKPTANQTIGLDNAVDMAIRVDAQDVGSGLAGVELWIDDKQVGETKVNQPYVWTTTLALGAHSIRANATDNASNRSSSPTVEVTVDENTNDSQNNSILAGCSQGPVNAKDAWLLYAILVLGLFYRFGSNRPRVCKG